MVLNINQIAVEIILKSSQIRDNIQKFIDFDLPSFSETSTTISVLLAYLYEGSLLILPPS